MQIDVVDTQDKTRVGIMEIMDGTVTIRVGDQLKIYNADKCGHLFFVVKPHDRTGRAKLVNGNMRTGNMLQVEAVRP